MAYENGASENRIQNKDNVPKKMMLLLDLLLPMSPEHVKTENHE